jgi:hypothetical protein
MGNAQSGRVRKPPRGREDSRQFVPRWHSTNYLIASAAILSVTNASIVSPALMSP